MIMSKLTAFKFPFECEHLIIGDKLIGTKVNSQFRSFNSIMRKRISCLYYRQASVGLDWTGQSKSISQKDKVKEEIENPLKDIYR